MSIFTDHPGDTENPQGYWEHGRFAFKNSLILIWAGLLGIIHSVCPWWFPFTTSTVVIQSFKKLVNSRRHKLELQKEMPEGYIFEYHKKIKR